MFHFSKAGICGATVEYRLTPKDRFPAQIEDVKCAVRWLRAHADDYDIDPTRIVAVGVSAGAHLAALLATTAGLPEFEGTGGNTGQSSSVSAAICLAGPYDLALGYRHSGTQRKAEGDTVRLLLESLLGGSLDQLPDAYRLASPISHVGPITAPLMLIHGAEDPLVLVEQAEVFAKKLREAGVPVEFLRIAEGTHNSFGKEPEKAIRAITDYARRPLKLGGE
jgi:acetyl esterase/lipase